MIIYGSKISEDDQKYDDLEIWIGDQMDRWCDEMDGHIIMYSKRQLAFTGSTEAGHITLAD